ncbi:MAG: hypothetical protein KDD82_11635 [Planctomycetes bacterium]|nr:hypothetical protein [Planctomycetota bacterium]
MIFTAMAIGAGIGALAGFAVYGAKVLLSKERTWSWKDAGAHALGGLVGGAAFPPILAGLAAVGLPAAVAYVAAGGVAWGGIWSLAQDSASWALGRSKGLRSAKHYLLNTALGMAATALLLPFATRVIGPAGQLTRHSGSVRAFLAPSSENLAANVLKSEAEFLAYGAITETVSVGARMTTHNAFAEGGGAVVRAVSATARTSAPQAASGWIPGAQRDVESDAAVRRDATASQDAEVEANASVFQRAGRRIPERLGSTRPEADLTGLIDVLEDSTPSAAR